ncbi:hypothetical protein AVEN_104806-1 [Araneus ventricosus]|uniref:Uncharacterized protein n=1 Tax=Araneus ventricosus TaxID=182803 RepID=A0A4Y2I8V5_ARAVE|nr:hypothetical protein AVEN_104806-1 [Araneus ventricosus]
MFSTIYRVVRYKCDKIARDAGDTKTIRNHIALQDPKCHLRELRLREAKKNNRNSNLLYHVALVEGYMLQKVFGISTRNSHTDFTAAAHGIPNVLEDSWHVSLLPGSF